jgi:hypothetical protein
MLTAPTLFVLVERPQEFNVLRTIDAARAGVGGTSDCFSRVSINIQLKNSICYASPFLLFIL